MRIRLLKDVASLKRVKGDTFDLTDEMKAKFLIEEGYAEVAPEEASILPEDVKKAFYELFKTASQGASDGAKGGKSGAHTGDFNRLDGSQTDLNAKSIFGSHGGFFHAVKAGCSTTPDRDAVEKLAAWDDMQRKAGSHAMEAAFNATNKSPSGNFEGNDPDGGALVPPEFSNRILERDVFKESFLGQTDQLVVRGNTLSVPALDDKSRADGSRAGGILGAYADEAQLLGTVSKPTFRTIDLRLKKLYVFAYMTDELLADSPYALEQYLTAKVADELVFKQNDGLIRGNGAGQPQGALNAKCNISVAAANGQATKTILNQNIEQMWMRFNAALRPNAQWYINQDCEYQLQTMALPIGIAGVPTYMPVGGVANPSFATLKGRPVKPVEFCETLGTSGDIILINWGAWQSITKGGIKTDMSMHVRFQYGEMAYRFTYRFDSLPKWDDVLTPYKGSNTTSPVVTLAAR